mmetsp:Transcript_62199/g.161315  ORF Transcript_62199/g.161315 Transcript_62199/m.161315 type:complete len:171 (+) Transcript_62199:306-818(+)
MNKKQSLPRPQAAHPLRGRASLMLLLSPPPPPPPQLPPALEEAEVPPPPEAPAAAPDAQKVSLADALPEPELGSSDMPTVGSRNHRLGNCKPCAFLHTKGCKNGQECPFCHLCERGEKKRRQKEKWQQQQHQQQQVQHHQLQHHFHQQVAMSTLPPVLPALSISAALSSR